MTDSDTASTRPCSAFSCPSMRGANSGCCWPLAQEREAQFDDGPVIEKIFPERVSHHVYMQVVVSGIRLPFCARIPGGKNWGPAESASACHAWCELGRPRRERIAAHLPGDCPSPNPMCRPSRCCGGGSHCPRTEACLFCGTSFSSRRRCARSLTERVAAALIVRDPGATQVQITAAEEKAGRAPRLVVRAASCVPSWRAVHLIPWLRRS